LGFKILLLSEIDEIQQTSSTFHLEKSKVQDLKFMANVRKDGV